MTTSRLALAYAGLLAAALCSCAGPPAAFEHPPLSAEALRSHVEVLAADDMQGREVGSAAAMRSAEYIAAVLGEAGWAPAGNEGTYLQNIGMAGFERDGALQALFEGPDGALLKADHGAELRWLRGPPVHVTLDLVLVKGPEDIPSTPDPHDALVLLADGRTAMSWLDEDRGQGWGALLIMGPSTEGMPTPPPKLLLGATNDPVLLMTRGSLPAALAAGRFDTLHLSLDSEEPVLAVNVVGLLPGTGPSDEVIILSAHYDHLGLADAGADRVFNGADDDASGVAMVLELARALAAGRPPYRTVMAVLVTGEEKGLLGSRAYVAGAPVPIEYTVAALNFEMVGRPDESLGGRGRLWLSGWERTTLGAELEAAGLPVFADPYPGQNFFLRSDNISFARVGIPAQTLSSFALHSDYHRVSDEVGTLDFDHMALAGEAALAVVDGLVTGALTPTWLPGGEP
ncbi:MAG: hypothetical protein DRQ55_12545 [Planctomycetota bacterium]|nr:MAG: hypothetical protein DRQ55_12545 [Planctomycetota bacterium]